MLLMLDNYDSFTYNLVHLFEELGAEVRVFRNDAITVEEAEALAPSHLVVSPGPGRPENAGISVELIRRLGPARALLHGKSSPVEHDGKGVYAELPVPFEAGRYHSLAALEVPDELEVTARAPDGEVMGVRHRRLPIEGVQFHPESVLTPLGPKLGRNFLERR